MDELIQSMVLQESERVNSQREQQVINQLEKFGYKFESKFHFIEFLKTRCRLETTGKLNSLNADDKLVAQWWDTIETKIDIKDGSYSVTSIFGKPPVTNTDI